MRCSKFPFFFLAPLLLTTCFRLKIDTWVPDFQKVIGEQIATIRRKLGVPIIFHVEDYVFGDAPMTLVEKEHTYFSLLEHGLRFGVEYLVVDLKYSPEGVRRLVRLSGRTKVIGQYLAKETTSWRWDDSNRMIEYANAKALGCDLLRFVRATSDPHDNNAVRIFLDRIDTIPNHIPVCNMPFLHMTRTRSAVCTGCGGFYEHGIRHLCF